VFRAGCTINHDRFYACLAPGSGRERFFSPGSRATGRRIQRDGSTRVIGPWSTHSHSARTGDERARLAETISGARAALLTDLGKKLLRDGHAGILRLHTVGAHQDQLTRLLRDGLVADAHTIRRG
jgi:hypothetical protein